MSRGILATATARLGRRASTPRRVRAAWEDDLRRRAVRAPAARGAVADDGCDARRQHRARAGRGRRARGPRGHRHRDRQPGQGHRRRRRCSRSTSRSACPRRSAFPWTESPREPSRRVALPVARRHRGRPASAPPASPPGLKASGTPDLALVVNDGPSQAAAAVFTTNRVVGAPVVWSRQAVADGVVSAVVLNSGGANVVHRPRGLPRHPRDGREGRRRPWRSRPGDVVVCSTGLIGERLPIDTLLAGVDVAVEALSADGGPGRRRRDHDHRHRPQDGARARRRRPGAWTVGGMAKGAGMLAPGAGDDARA